MERRVSRGRKHYFDLGEGHLTGISSFPLRRGSRRQNCTREDNNDKNECGSGETESESDLSFMYHIAATRSQDQFGLIFHSGRLILVFAQFRLHFILCTIQSTDDAAKNMAWMVVSSIERSISTLSRPFARSSSYSHKLDI